MTDSPTVTHLDMTRFDLPLLIDAFHLKRGVEIGVFQGYFSYYLLRHSRIESLWCVDNWAGKWMQFEEDARTCLREFADRARIIRMPSEEAAKLAVDGASRFDFVYIDGNHRSRAVRADLDAWLPLAASPCLFAGHDYWQAGMTGVVAAVNEFAARLHKPLYVTRERCASWFMILE